INGKDASRRIENKRGWLLAYWEAKGKPTFEFLKNRQKPKAQVGGGEATVSLKATMPSANPDANVAADHANSSKHSEAEGNDQIRQDFNRLSVSQRHELADELILRRMDNPFLVNRLRKRVFGVLEIEDMVELARAKGFLDSQAAEVGIVSDSMAMPPSPTAFSVTRQLTATEPGSKAGPPVPPPSPSRPSPPTPPSPEELAPLRAFAARHGTNSQLFAPPIPDPPADANVANDSPPLRQTA
ncbi:MAG: hypothetical protein WCI73_08605, partial [Phycisphaerae bacterium]